MAEHPKQFAELFKKYRLKAEIPTLSQFGHLLADKGFNYEDSIFSHWQKSSRIPQYRILLLKLLEIFVERNALTLKEHADEFLASANQGSLSEEELKKLGLKFESSVFQVPNEIADFTGREEIINGLINRDLTGKIILIHGPAGVGKTALAIRLGHLLKNKYQDGVLWYKVEEDNISDIFFSIAKVLGEDISGIADLQVRGTVVRSLLAAKNVLLFLDSAELYTDLQILIPNSTLCTTIITSQKNQLKIPNNYLPVKVEAFTKDETLTLFQDVLKEKYNKISRSSLLKIGEKVGNLPLAIHLLASELLKRNIDTVDLLRGGLNEGNSLDSAIAVSYEKLSNKNKSVLLSASIFKGKDFSSDSIAYINGLSKLSVVRILEDLTDLSLVEHSTKNRFRIHPAIKEFVRDKLDYPRSSWLVFIAILILFFYSSGWILLQTFSEKESLGFQVFAVTYCIMALYGGLCGLHTSLNWGGLKTLIGKSVFMLSLGLLFQVFGQLAYAYYIHFEKIAVPYPSLGDIGYFGTIPFYIYGAYLLAKSSGISLGVQSFKKKIAAVLIPIFMLVTTYIFFLQDYTVNLNNPIKLFLDFGYPFGESIAISIAIITFIFSRTILDGILRSKALLVLIALVAQFIADYIFLYFSDSFYSGSVIDLLYLVAYFIMTLALLSLKSINVKVY